jgi:hypothetical protein
LNVAPRLQAGILPCPDILHARATLKGWRYIYISDPVP